MTLQPSRRGFITGLVSLAVTAPAIVKSASLMPVKLMLPSRPSLIYSNRVIRRYVDIEAFRDRNILLRITEDVNYLAVPIRVIDLGPSPW